MTGKWPQKAGAVRHDFSLIAFLHAYLAPPGFSPTLVAKLAALEVVQGPLAQMPTATLWAATWAHHVISMKKVKDLIARRWYVEQTVAEEEIVSGVRAAREDAAIGANLGGLGYGA